MSENLRHILVLTVICLVTASLLTGVYFLTNPRILSQKEKAEREALREVIPEAGYFEPVTQEDELVYLRAYVSADKQTILGYAFKTQGQGYSGLIETMAGIDTNGEITGIKILNQNETPGLGAKIEEVLVQKTFWQAVRELFVKTDGAPQPPEASQPWFCAQFKGKKIADLVAVTQPTENNIQAITGATVSSQALTDSVREKAKEILKYER